MDDAARRQLMVEAQLRPANVTNPRVLDAMGKTPRTIFLPTQLKPVAYNDDDIRLPDGRFLIEPVVLARLLELAEPTESSTALVVGCDTGYAAVVMASLAATVFTVVHPDFIAEVEARAGALDAVNVLTVPGAEPLEGHAEKAPYDVILVVGRMEELPATLGDQLAEAGRLVAVIGDARVGRGTLVSRVHNRLGRRNVFDAAIPPVRAPALPPRFEF